MKLKKRQKQFLEKSVLGFGFISGIFVSLGISPVQNVIDFSLNSIKPSQYIVFALTIIPILLLIYSITIAYNKAKFLGLISVFISFLAGFFIFFSVLHGVLLLLISVILGVYASEKRIF